MTGGQQTETRKHGLITDDPQELAERVRAAAQAAIPHLRFGIIQANVARRWDGVCIMLRVEAAGIPLLETDAGRVSEVREGAEGEGQVEG
jgi:hypothetical protein